MVSRSQSLAAPLLLTFSAGCVDTAGFLAIAGLSTAHVTGNFVTIGAALVAGSAVVVTKLLALPAFCLAILSARLAFVILSINLLLRSRDNHTWTG